MSRDAGLALLLGIGLLSGCSPDEAQPERYGGTVVIATNADLDLMNGLVAGERYAQEVNSFMLFLPLLRHGPDLDYEPVLAESWETEGDTAFVFRLRRDVRWHDGVPTTATDVVFTFERSKDPATTFPNADAVADWLRAEAIDSFTVRLTFTPHLDPLAGFPRYPIMPAHHLSGIPPAQLRNARFNREPVGNGPFRFVEQRANDRTVFEANTDFPDALGGRPFVDRIVIRTIPDATAQVTEILTGGADVLLSPRADQYTDLASRPGYYGIMRPGRQYVSIWWNGRRPIIGDPRFRRAMTMAIDRDRIIATLRDGLGEPAVGPVAPYHWAYDRNVAPLPYSPDSARSLLADVGLRDRNGDGFVELPDGRSFQVELKIPAGSPLNRDMAEMIRHDLAQVGVWLTVRPLDLSALVQDFSGPQRNFEGVLMSWNSALRINLRDTFHSTRMEGQFQFAGYGNPRVDELIDQLSEARTRREAIPLYREVQQILREEQPWSFLYYSPDLAVLRDRVTNVHMDIRGALVGVARWQVAPDTVAN
jgi:peptide/nickel transport system substrate-binding protein